MACNVTYNVNKLAEIPGFTKTELNKLSFPFLKGVFAKNERGYRLNAIKKRY